ncbi:MAG: serine protease [Bacteriovoracaceae bacterium]
MKLSFTLLLVSCLSYTTSSFSKVDVIYGEDNRKDVFESHDSIMVENSKSTAAMISATSLKATGSDLKVLGPTLKERGICEEERFSSQSVAASCSGFLVSENILVTAGHCIKSEIDCQSYKWVFDYKVDSSNQSEITVPASSVYSCKKILDRKLEALSKNDYAVIELDRKVRDRRPLTFRRNGKIQKGAAVVVIGHPTGLPTKIADGANVRSLASKFFVANLDTYGGNSGSAVFNAKTGDVEGILVRGDDDYVYDSKKGCQLSHRCENNACRGEDVTFITNIDLLKKIP